MSLGQEVFLIYVKTTAEIDANNEGCLQQQDSHKQEGCLQQQASHKQTSEEFNNVSPSQEENAHDNPHIEGSPCTSSSQHSTGQELANHLPEHNMSKKDDKTFGYDTIADSEKPQNKTNELEVNDMYNVYAGQHNYFASNHVTMEKLGATQQDARSLYENSTGLVANSLHVTHNGSRNTLSHTVTCSGSRNTLSHTVTCSGSRNTLSHAVSCSGSRNTLSHVESCQQNKSRISFNDKSWNASHGQQNISRNLMSGQDNVSSCEENVSVLPLNSDENVSMSVSSYEENISVLPLPSEENVPMKVSLCEGKISKNSSSDKENISRNALLYEKKIFPDQDNISRTALLGETNVSLNVLSGDENFTTNSLPCDEIDTVSVSVANNSLLDQITSDTEIGSKIDVASNIFGAICNKEYIENDDISITTDINKVTDDAIDIQGNADTSCKNNVDVVLDNSKECTKNEGETMQTEIRTRETAENHTKAQDTSLLDKKPPLEDNKEEEEEFIKEHKIESKKLTALLHLLNTAEGYTRNKSNAEKPPYEGQSELGKGDSRRSSGEDEKPKLKKCSSLKTCRTPPKADKKLVKFADSFGLELNSIKTFKGGSVPQVPKSAYDDLDFDDLDLSEDTPPNADRLGKMSPPSTATSSLVPMFTQPSASSKFANFIRSRTVCLENAYIEAGLISGTVRVRNLHFEKSVTVRWTTNEWQSCHDMEASYIQGSSDGFTDKFKFQLEPGTVKLGERLQFCLRYRTAGQEFWDNNLGANYVFQVFMSNVQPMQLGGLERTEPIDFHHNENRKYGFLDHTNKEWDPCSY